MSGLRKGNCACGCRDCGYDHHCGRTSNLCSYMPHDIMVSDEVEASEDTKFFEYGEVRLEEVDHHHRQAVLECCLPNCLLQTLTPSLLGSGVIDSFRVREPHAVWLPKLGRERFNQTALTTIDSVEARVNQTVRERVEESMRVFQGVSQLVNNPADLIPMLPFGIYVNFRYRCYVDKIPNILCSIDMLLALTGVPEFQWALASVLKQVLTENEVWVKRNKR